ncbi:uncharacterized protein DC041_0004525 [Schistosoma bovis]|uniref:Uncharacterized protein n=1 Tax=Schistosoma bovis TaxID=6184 RepID=A0A430Q374_SCHBO|nr:uncharacterized protein DC041_0004525 [Schistosoma bovis]
MSLSFKKKKSLFYIQYTISMSPALPKMLSYLISLPKQSLR